MEDAIPVTIKSNSDSKIPVYHLKTDKTVAQISFKNYVCNASSRVGESRTALKPTPLFGPASRDKTGSENASVFPDPVGADAKVFRLKPK